MMNYADRDHTVIAVDGRFIPADPDNAEYAALISAGAVIQPFAGGSLHADQVRAACDAAISSALGGQVRQSSMQREAVHLVSLVASGQTLSAEQLADAATLTAINTWETSMIATREAAIAAGTPVASITWPPPPAGVTATWLEGF